MIDYLKQRLDLDLKSHFNDMGIISINGHLIENCKIVGLICIVNLFNIHS
jgi:glycerol-3-phosphate responsive antiterminator